MNNPVHFTVIFRACDKVVAVNNNPRPLGLNKTDLVKICFLSLKKSLESVPHRIIVLGDSLSDNLLDFFKNQEVELHLGTFGNEKSFRKALELALSVSDDEWLYLCEDDYLHAPDAFQKIKTFIQEADSILMNNFRIYNPSTWINLKNKDLFLFPPDYPDRYAGKHLKHSLVLISSNSHWRQVSHITFTFITKSATLKKHINFFFRASKGANDRKLSRKLFGRLAYGWFTPAVCFSPVPGLSSHMHRDTMTPLVDWEYLARHYQQEIKQSWD